MSLGKRLEGMQEVGRDRREIKKKKKSVIIIHTCMKFSNNQNNKKRKTKHESRRGTLW